MSTVFLSAENVNRHRLIVDEDCIADELLPHCVKLCSSLDEAQQFRTGSQWVAPKDDKYGVYSPKEGYISVFSYDKESVVKYKAEHSGSLQGYTPDFEESGIYANWFVGDIDCGEDGANAAVHQIVPMLKFFEENKIVYHLFLSGNKGVHYNIPMDYFSYPDAFKLHMHEVLLSAAKYLSERFHIITDQSIYNISSLIRKPYTLHSKVNKPKIEIKIDFSLYDPSKHFKDFVTPVWRNTNEIKLLINEMISPFQGHAKFFELKPTKRTVLETHAADIDRSKGWRTSSYTDACIIGMLNDTRPKERHNSLLRIMSSLYLMGIPPKIAAGIMLEWINRLEPQAGKEPYTKETVMDEMRYWGKYTYNCNDYYRLTYCNQSCRKYRQLALSNEMISSTQAIDEYQRYLKRDRQEDIFLGDIFPGMDIHISPAEAHIVGLVGAPGVGKTIAACQFMLGLTVPVVFFSYEMNRISVVKMFCKLLGMDPENPDNEAYRMFTQHIWIEDSGLITPDDHESYIKSIEEKNGIKIKVIVVDFIQNCPVRDPNDPRKIVFDETASMNRVTKVAKSNAKRMGIAYFFLSQVPKEQSAGNIPIRLMDAKGSQALQAICDLGITIWRPNMIVERPDIDLGVHKPDDCVTMLIDKSRSGELEKTYLNYEFNRTTLAFNTPYEGVIVDVTKKKDGKWERKSN